MTENTTISLTGSALLRQTEIEETAETLIEDRGATNALAWANHCATRSTDGFWRMVRNEIVRQATMAKLKGSRA